MLPSKQARTHARTHARTLEDTHKHTRTHAHRHTLTDIHTCCRVNIHRRLNMLGRLISRATSGSNCIVKLELVPILQRSVAMFDAVNNQRALRPTDAGLNRNLKKIFSMLFLEPNEKERAQRLNAARLDLSSKLNW